jgi:hypothetical protein
MFKIKVHPSTVNRRLGHGFTQEQAEWGYADHRDIMSYINDLRAVHGDPPVSKLPRDFSCTLWLPLTDGREVVATVSEGAPSRPGRWGLIKSSAHRVHVNCPDCGHRVPVGRTHQHKCRS